MTVLRIPTDILEPHFQGERLKALLLWFLERQSEKEFQHGFSSPNITPAMRDALLQMDSRTCYDLLGSLSEEDLAAFSILNEFGLDFSKHPAYRLIKQGVAAYIKNPSF